MSNFADAEFGYNTFILITKRAGLPKITLHGLRHTAGSLLLDAGCSS